MNDTERKDFFIGVARSLQDDFDNRLAELQDYGLPTFDKDPVLQTLTGELASIELELGNLGTILADYL